METCAYYLLHTLGEGAFFKWKVPFQESQKNKNNLKEQCHHLLEVVEIKELNIDFVT